MSVLKTLNFVVAAKRSNDPTILRRAKLLIQLQQQRALAENPLSRINHLQRRYGRYWANVRFDAFRNSGEPLVGCGHHGVELMTWIAMRGALNGRTTK